ncbi:MAG: NAD(P)/FAD-dependent oxidoreductase [Flavobacteriaceae bacterium]
MKNPEVLIVGGGLAGLTAALDLVNRGIKVLVVEKTTYPNHKVCGEYVSNEVKPYLEHLGVTFDDLQLPKINTLHISTQAGKLTQVDLPLGGFGISRYALDHRLFLHAKKVGVEFLFNTVTDIHFQEDKFVVSLSSRESIVSKVVLGAFGKRSNLDMRLRRGFMQQKSPWLGIKCHYKNNGFPSNVVGLHNFPGGYGGLSEIEDGSINFCYLARYESFKAIGDVNAFNEKIVSQNPILKEFLTMAEPKFEKPLSIAQISFERKKTVEDRILMCGDTAGLIHPLCGNGMAMAVHSAKLVASQVAKFLENVNFTRDAMEKEYEILWKRNFKNRLWMGRQLQNLMLHTNWFNLGMGAVTHSKLVLRSIIERTHGNPILS